MGRFSVLKYNNWKSNKQVELHYSFVRQVFVLGAGTFDDSLIMWALSSFNSQKDIPVHVEVKGLVKGIKTSTQNISQKSTFPSVTLE